MAAAARPSRSRPTLLAASLAVLVGLAGLAMGCEGGARGAPTSPPGTAATAGATATPVPDCPGSQQPLIDAAAPGGRVVLAACVARETLRLDKPVTLTGAPGAEIRGSDVWTAWGARGPVWVSAQTVPTLHDDGVCASGTQRCRWPEQAFRDGVALVEVAQGSVPRAGEFALDAARHVLLGEDPTGHRIEVTTRTRWVELGADGIVIEGLRMRHAANASQEGALTDEGHQVTVRGCVLSDAHGAVVSLTGTGSLIDNDISRGGQLGVHGGGALVRGNRIHDNGLLGFDPGWEAGGLKSNLPRQRIEGNEVYDNAGPGIWLDGASGPIEILDGRVHDNLTAGILFEASSEGRIAGNRIWGNGMGDAEWGWGGGIVLSSARQVEVHDNVVAWNADGITVISQARDDAPGPVTGIRVHGNLVAATDGVPDPRRDYALAWLEDWPGALFTPGSGNTGTDNAFWYTTAEGRVRFAWRGDLTSLAAFATTPGGRGSRYLTSTEAAALLAAADVPMVGP